MRSGAGMDDTLTWYTAAAQAAEDSLAQLRSIPSLPEADQALVNRFHFVVEHEVELLGHVAGAALFGDRRRVRRLVARRVVAAQRKGAVVTRMSVRWDLDLEPLLNCPLMLPG